jgi:hypothetical protein
VIAKAGRFLNWCKSVGITRDKAGFHFPEKPRVGALRAALRKQFEEPSEEIRAWIAALTDEQVIGMTQLEADLFFGHVETADDEEGNP